MTDHTEKSLHRTRVLRHVSLATEKLLSQ